MTSSSQTSGALGFWLRLLSRLPLGFLQAFAALVAGIFAWFPEQGMLRTVRRNLQLAFPNWTPQQVNRIAKRAVHHQLLSIMEFVKCWGNPPADSLKRIIKVHDESLLHQALQHPNGCIAIVPHYGSWEIMNAWLNQFAAPVIMYKPDGNPDLDAFVLAARSRLNATLVPTDETGVRQIFRALKQGGFTIILPDHIPDASGGIVSPFFGLPVLTSTLAAKLAQKTQCAVVQLSCIRSPQDPQSFEITVEKAHPDLLSRDLGTAVNALNITMQRLIERAPEHYHWSYKRFKDTPFLSGYYHCDDASATVMRQQAHHAAQQQALKSPL
jgi:KDO2-lipid IV(A) lauroyltransferase